MGAIPVSLDFGKSLSLGFGGGNLGEHSRFRGAANVAAGDIGFVNSPQSFNFTHAEFSVSRLERGRPADGPARLCSR